MSAAETTALRVTCWGTRGSIPAPGPETVRFGGNTSCVEARAGDGRRYVFDAGSGIRAQGRAMESDGAAGADLFLTHYHWDHIQGFPFWAALYSAASRVRVHGPRSGGVSVADAIHGQMGGVHYPITLDRLPGAVEFADVSEREPWTDGAVEVRAFPARHSGLTYAYRVRAEGATVVYAPDNELGGADPAWYAAFAEFVRGADLLLHDAMYTDEEYARFHGRGHSTFSQAVRLAEEAGVRRLHFFHHAPSRGDAQLEAIAAACRTDAEARGSTLEIGVATEGEEIAIGGRGM
jgi:phosphoribosyl 1,2-cyclic phosphodiesterase